MKKGCPEILVDLGKRLSKAVNSEEGIALADACEGDSWVCGACDTLAIAIYRWLGPIAVPYILWDLSKVWFHHMVVKIDRCFLDADGISTRNQLLDRWMIESQGKPILIEKANLEELVYNCIMPIRSRIDRVITFLDDHLGDGPAIASVIKRTLSL